MKKLVMSILMGLSMIFSTGLSFAWCGCLPGTWMTDPTLDSCTNDAGLVNDRKNDAISVQTDALNQRDATQEFHDSLIDAFNTLKSMYPDCANSMEFANIQDEIDSGDALMNTASVNAISGATDITNGGAHKNNGDSDVSSMFYGSAIIAYSGAWYDYDDAVDYYDTAAMNWADAEACYVNASNLISSFSGCNCDMCMP